MPGKGTHTAKFDRCVEQVMAKGNEQASAYAICTTQFQKSGEDILNAEQSRGLHLVGATSKARHDTWKGKPYLVVPTIMLMEGVIHAVNAETPEFVPKTLIETDPSQWDGHPILLGHAVKGGKQCSAHDDAIQAAQRFGTIRNTYAKDGKLAAESWCDLARLKELGRDDVVRRLEEGDPIQVSVGAFVSSDDSKNGEHRHKKYKGQWLAYRADHLAFLPDGRGACSLDMGCGTHRAATMRVLADRFEVETPELRAAAGARHSASDMKTIQAVHDHATTLGAKCSASNTQFMSYASRNLANSTRAERTSALLTVFRAGQPYDMPDTPAQAASEEAAELIGYKTLRMLFDQVGQSWDEASALIDDLITDEEENPTETAADEEAEEEIEDARLQAINALCSAMWSALSSAQGVTSRLLMPDPAEVAATRRYMSAGKDCPTCDGTGQVKDGKKQNDCPACEGSGKIRAAANPEGLNQYSVGGSGGGATHKESHGGVGAGPQSHDPSRAVVVNHHIGGTNASITGPHPGTVEVHKDERGFVVTDARGRHPDTGGTRHSRVDSVHATREKAIQKGIDLMKAKGKLRGAEDHACGCDGACTCQPRAAIKHEGGKWVLYSKDGSRRLGTHDTEADAIAHNSAIDAAKKRRELESQSVTH